MLSRKHLAVLIVVGVLASRFGLGFVPLFLLGIAAGLFFND